MVEVIPCDSNIRKRKIRTIISPIDGVIVDESDYRVVDGIFQDCLEETRRHFGARSEENNENEAKIMDIRTMFGVRKDDSTRRVSQLTILESNQRSLPKSLLCLDALEVLKIVPTRFPIPKWLGDLKSLQKLTIFLDEDQALPSEVFSHLPNLQVLDIVGETRATFPTKNIINGNENLKGLVISMEHAPDEVGYFTNLETLRFGPSCISIPPSIGGLKNLKTLIFEECHNLIYLPKEVGELNLQVLRIWCCSGLRSLPQSVGNIANLQVLDLEDSSGLSELPKELENLTRLEYLNLKGCLGLGDGGQPLPIEKLQNMRVLNLSELDAVLPENIGNLTRLEFLDLSHTNIASFPKSFRNLASLKGLNLDGCAYDDDENLQDLVGACFSGLEIPSVCSSLDYLHLYSADRRDETRDSSVTNAMPVEPKPNLSFSFQLNVSRKGSSKHHRAV